MPYRTHFFDAWMQRSIISNETISYLYFGVLPGNMWMSLLHSTSHYSLRKSLKDLIDHLNFFVSCQGRFQLSPAIFRASRNHLVALKQSYDAKIIKIRRQPRIRQGQPYSWSHMLKLSKSGINGQSVQVSMAYDLIYNFCNLKNA